MTVRPNRKHFNRTKEELIEQAYHFAVNDYHRAVKYAVIDDIIWHWTHSYEKKAAYWSENALLNGKKIIEDHVVPRKYIHDFLIEQTPKYLTKDDVDQLLHTLLKSCVITEVENEQLQKMKLSETMPVGFTDPTHPDYHNPWIRYKLAGITPVKVAWQTMKTDIEMSNH